MILSGTLTGLCISLCLISCGKDNETFSSGGIGTPGNGNGTQVQETAYAFPGAEGAGRNATGGRGGKIYYVTSLNDDLSDNTTLRYALSRTEPRIIIFKISGTIKLKKELAIESGDVTIAGQTAPGDGICLAGYPVMVKADNVIIRYMRFRLGDAQMKEDINTGKIDATYADGADALGGTKRKNIIIDHCSVSWCIDECASFYDNSNFTMQWCLISESLRLSLHSKEAHGYGGIWGGKNASFHHNLLAHHDSRNPRFNGSRMSKLPDLEKVDFRNNVIYNWRGNSSYAGEGGSYNLINNYYKPGPATEKSSTAVKYRIFSPNADLGEYSGGELSGQWGKFYVFGNYMGATSTTSAKASEVRADNWVGIHPNEQNNYPLPTGGISAIKSPVMFTDMGDATSVTTHSAENAYARVCEYAGCSLTRDDVDIRIINEVKTGTATYSRANYPGIIDSQETVGGWPTLNSTTPPVDSDGDGMPDEWEEQNGLNPNSYNNPNAHTLSSGYTDIEVYLNSLVKDITEAQNK